MINVQQLTAQVLLKGGAILVIFPCFSVQFTNTPASGQQASMAKEISQILLTHRQCWGPVRRIRMFADLQDPDPNPLVRCTDPAQDPAPDPSLF
jgi:hypothetical protein